MKSWNADHFDKGYYAVAIRNKRFMHERWFQVEIGRPDVVITLSVLGLVGLRFDRNEFGWLFSVGASWAGSLGVGWHR